jgi:hypothetical protein
MVEPLLRCISTSTATCAFGPKHTNGCIRLRVFGLVSEKCHTDDSRPCVRLLIPPCGCTMRAAHDLSKSSTPVPTEIMILSSLNPFLCMRSTVVRSNNNSYHVRCTAGSIRSDGANCASRAEVLARDEAYSYWNDTHNPALPPPAQSKAQHGTILGLRRRNFWIISTLVFIIVGATIGGSVGGAMAVRSSGYVYALSRNGSVHRLTTI